MQINIKDASIRSINIDPNISMKYATLDDRAVISITGVDSAYFLQNIITNDINKAVPGVLLYSLLLNPQGKILCDLFILAIESGFLLDCPKEYLSTLLQKLSMYKLRSNVTINPKRDFKVAIAPFLVEGHKFLPDPRSSMLCYRYITSNIDHGLTYDSQIRENYIKARMSLKIPEAFIDFWPEKFFPLELGLDKFNAIDYKKGCYIGQEVTARTTYRGIVRKQLYKLQFTELAPSHGSIVCADSSEDGQNNIGIVLGSYQNYCLALLYVEKISTAMHHGYMLSAAGQYIIEVQ